MYLLENPKSIEDEIEILESNSQMLNSPTIKKTQRRKRDQLYWEKVADGEVVHTGPFTFESSNSEDKEDLQHQLLIEYFRRFFDNAILNLIVNQSNLYSVQKDLNKPLNLNQIELEQCLGICFYFSIFKISSTKLHWPTCMSQDKITSLMTRDRFQQIKSNFHLVDNSKKDPKDKLFKIKPLVEYLKKKFKNTQMIEELSIDE